MRFISKTNYILISLLLTSAALSAALIAEYQFNLTPCKLCIYQRIPYSFVVLIGLIGLAFRKDQKISSFTVKAVTTLFFINMLIAIHHAGVEQHWWQSQAGCEGMVATSVEELRAYLMSHTTPACDQVNWTLLGFSMASYNVLFSFFLGSFGVLTILKGISDGRKKEQREE